MQIRNQLLLITILSAFLSAAAMSYIFLIREDTTQSENIKAFKGIYQAAWNNAIEIESNYLEEYGPIGPRGEPWKPMGPTGRPGSHRTQWAFINSYIQYIHRAI